MSYDNVFFADPLWRYSSKSARFFIFDHRLSYFVLLFVLNMSWNMLYLFFAMGFSLWVIEKKYEYNLPCLYRRLRVLISGKYKPSVSQRRLVKSR